MAKESTGLRSIADARGEMLRVDPRKLKIEKGWNQREEGPELDAHIDGLAQSIAEVGVRNPLKVVWKDGEAYVRSGHCRLRAAMRAIDVYKAEVKTVPVVAEDRYADEATQVLGQIVDNDGLPLSAFEKAKVYKKLINLGWQAQEIAKKCGKSPAHINQVLDLLLLPDSIRSMITKGMISATLAIQMFKGTGNNVAKTMAEIEKAIDNAKVSGRTKAKPSDVAPNVKGSSQRKEPKSNTRTTLREIFGSVQAFTRADEPGIVIVRMTANDFEELQGCLGIGINIEEVE